MSVRIVRNQDLVRMPWRNGGGTTAEIAIEPRDANLDGFDWRISMADVATEGPFSIFPGIDRSLSLIEGVSLDLEVDGIRHRLDGSSRSLRFEGEATTSARLPSGPIRDFNVMTRRTTFRHWMNETGHAGVPGSILILVALENGCDAGLEGETFKLDRFDVLIADPYLSGALTSGPMLSLGIGRI